MRNLRKYFAVFLAVALLVTAVAPAFAADTADTATTTTAPAAAVMADSKICETLGMLKGESGSVTDEYLATEPTKLQAAIMFLRLKGLEKDALAFKGTESFKDADKVDWDGGKAILAYLKSKADLGFIGNTDGTFEPNAAITAQQYYKILLVALGYKEGTDFKFEDTLKFAESKGLKKAASVTKFTINDLAVATVEALKADTSDKKGSLVQALIDAKVIDQSKAATTGLAGSTAPATSFTLKAQTAKSLYAKFNGVIADTSKAAITVTRDAGIAVTLTATWDKDSSGVVLASQTNLVAGEYKVAIKYDTKTDLGSQTATIDTEKIAKIEMVSKTITRRSDTEGVAYYKVTNQYGDDVTKNPIASNITWNSSLGTNNSNGVTADKGALTFYKDDGNNIYMGYLKDQTSVVVTAYDSDSNTVMNETLTVSSTIGDIQDVKLLGLSNKDKKTSVEKATTDVWYLDYEFKDSNGNLVTDYKILSNTNAFKLSPGTSNESTIAYAEVVQDPDDNKMAKLQVKVPQSNGIAGTQIINAISIATGKSANYNVTVVEGAVLQQLILQKPATDVAIGDGYVEIPYVALDSNGVQMTDYSKIKTDKLSISGIDSSKIQQIQNPDGSYKLLVDFGSTKTSYTLSATVNTTTTVKMSTISVSVKEAAAPKSIISLSSSKFIPGLVYKAKTGDKADKIVIYDQYDRPVDLRHRSNLYTVTKDNTNTDYYYYLVAKVNSSDLPIISVNNWASASSDIYQKVVFGNDLKFEVFANSQTGSANVTLYLYRSTTNASKDASTIIPTGAEQIDSKTFTFYNVDKKDISSYFIDGVDSVLYANSANWKLNGYIKDGLAPKAGDYVPNTYTDPMYWKECGSTNSSLNYYVNDTWFGEYVSDAIVRGKYNGMKVELNARDIVSYTVSETDKWGFYIEPDNNLYPDVYAQKGDKKVWARYVDDDEHTGTLTAVVKGYNNVVTTATAALNSKPVDTALAQAASISVGFNDGLKGISGISNSSIYVRPFLQYGTSGDIFRVNVTYANSRFLGKRITKYPFVTGATQGFDGYRYGRTDDASDNTLNDRADLFFAVKDQYGKEGLAPTGVTMTVERGTTIIGTSDVAYDASTGFITKVSGSFAFQDGDVISLTAYTGNGVSKAIKIFVQSDASVDYTKAHK